MKVTVWYKNIECKYSISEVCYKLILLISNVSCSMLQCFISNVYIGYIIKIYTHFPFYTVPVCKSTPYYNLCHFQDIPLLEMYILQINTYKL